MRAAAAVLRVRAGAVGGSGLVLACMAAAKSGFAIDRRVLADALAKIPCAKKKITKKKTALRALYIGPMDLYMSTRTAIH